MSANSRNGVQRRCPLCGQGELRRRLISESYEYGDKDDLVIVQTRDVPLEDCTNCGETFSGPEAARVRHDAVGLALGLMQPKEIRALRERLGLSPEEFSKLIGVKKDHLCQWESGTAWQDRAVDRLLRLLEVNPENYGLLQSIVSGKPGSPSAPSPTTRTDRSGQHKRRIIRKAHSRPR